MQPSEGSVAVPDRGTATRVYLIGAGVIARHHANAVAKLPDGSRVALSVADPNPVALDEFCSQFPRARRFIDAAEMLGEPATAADIVVVATPPFTHRVLALLALGSGRHVLCEKPLAMDAAEAREMLEAARGAGRLLGCCSTRFLGYAPTEAAKRAIDAGALGTLYHATFVNRWRRDRTGLEYQPSSPWFLDRSRSGGGTLMDWSPYDFTTLNHVLDPVRVEVHAAWMTSPETVVALPDGAVFDTEQHVGAALRYHRRNGQVIDVAFERAACTHGAERRIVEVEGARGAVRWEWIDDLGDGSVTVTRDQDGVAVEETTHPADSAETEIHSRPLLYFAARVRGEPSPAVVDERAIFNFACLQAVYECVRTGAAQSVALEGS